MAFNNAAPTIMYNYQTLAPKPTLRPAHDPKILKSLNRLIFIHKIPSFLDDDDVLHVLAGCGSVDSWNRVCSGNGTMHHYGFCVFEKEISVVRALRSLSNPVKLEGYDLNINTMEVMIDLATKNNLFKKFKSDLQVTEPDYEVLQRLQYVFEPFVSMEKEEFDNLLEEGKPPKTGELVAHNELQFDEEEETPEEIETKRKKKALEAERSFLSRKQRFEHQLISKISNQKKNEQILQHRITQKATKNKELLDYYAHFDDDVVRKSGGTLFFDDAARWWRTRRPILQKEYEMDMRMRGADESKKAKNEELKRLKRQEQKAIEAATFLDNLELDQEDEEEAENVLPIMTAEARAQRVQELVASIPTQTSDLFKFNVNWSFIDNTVIETRFRPWLEKKLKSMLGDDSKLLVDYILKLVENQTVDCVFKILKEVEKVLEEEAESFVGMFWRLVIFESEARATGLA